MSLNNIILFFGLVSIISALMVITESNTVNAVFYLVLTFVNTAVILIITGVDYLGLLLIIVYCGAIAILFVFTVMMINVKAEEFNRAKYTPIGLIVIVVLILEVYMAYPSITRVVIEPKYELNGALNNIRSLGEIMYNWEIVLYGGLVLLVAMIGAIVLTLHHSSNVKRQDLFTKWTS